MQVRFHSGNLRLFLLFRDLRQTLAGYNSSNCSPQGTCACLSWVNNCNSHDVVHFSRKCIIPNSFVFQACWPAPFAETKEPATCTSEHKVSTKNQCSEAAPTRLVKPEGNICPSSRPGPCLEQRNLCEHCVPPHALQVGLWRESTTSLKSAGLLSLIKDEGASPLRHIFVWVRILK